jgi:hypothetical protein
VRIHDAGNDPPTDFMESALLGGVNVLKVQLFQQAGFLVRGEQLRQHRLFLHPQARFFDLSRYPSLHPALSCLAGIGERLNGHSVEIDRAV